MANIENIQNGESGLSARNKINAAIAEANAVDGKIDKGQVGAENVTTATGTQTVAGALDDRKVGFDIRAFGVVGDEVTDDTSAIASAVAAVKAAGSQAQLNWSNLRCLTTATIPDLHYIRHSGSGTIIRDSDEFHITPRGFQTVSGVTPLVETNTIYCGLDAAGADDANDGLSSGQPIRNARRAIEVVKNWAEHTYSGQWRIVFLEGNHTAASAFNMPKTMFPIVLEGVRDVSNNNISVFDIANAGSAVIGLNFASPGGASLQFKYLKFTGFASGGAGCGINTRYGMECDFIDIETDGCDAGIFAFDGRYRLFGGRFLNGQYGARFSYQSDVTTYNSFLTTNRPFASNMSGAGFAFERGCMGRLEYVDTEDCTDGVLLGEMSRVHVLGCNFKRSSQAAIHCRGGSQWLDNPDVVNEFNLGTVDSNALIHLLEGDSRETRVHGQADGTGEVRAYIFPDLFNLTSSTTETAIVSTARGVTTNICGRMPAGYFAGVTQAIRVRLTGVFSGVDSKTLRVFLRSVLVGELTTSAAGAFTAEWYIYPDNASTQRVSGILNVSGQAPVMEFSTRAYSANDAELQVNFKVQHGGTAATTVIRRCETFFTG